MPNERITEDYVRDHFKNDPLFSAIKLDEQKTSVVKAKGCLAKASKNLTGKGGSPEFIISFPALPDDIIVVECKADAKFHESADGKNPTAYAVDGALHYSAFLAQEYNVISIAVSGSKLGKLKISSFYQKGRDRSQHRRIRTAGRVFIHRPLQGRSASRQHRIR